MTRSISPYPELRAVRDWRPESEAPPPLEQRDTDHDELTDPETPMALDDRLQSMDKRLALLERGQKRIVDELCRHRSAEVRSRVAHGSLPWAALLVALVALAVSVYRMGEPAIMTVERIPAQGVVFQ